MAIKIRPLILICLTIGALCACKHSIDINDQDRDLILGKLDQVVTHLTDRVQSLEVTFTRERGQLTQDLQQTLALAIANLHSVAEQLDQSVERMRVGITNFQETLTADVMAAIAGLTATTERLERNLASDASATVLQLARQVEAQRVAALRQAHQMVQTTVRPTIERLHLEGDYFVGSVTLQANVILVRALTGAVAIVALVGMILILVRLKATPRRRAASGIAATVFLAGGLSATVLAAPISRIGAPTYKFPSGNQVCGDMLTLRGQVEKLAKGLTPSSSNAHELESLTRKLLERSNECAVLAPTAEYADQARDGFVLASNLLGLRVRCTTHADCAAQERCNAETGICMAVGDYCDTQIQCTSPKQCIVAEHRCVDPEYGSCATPVDCRPEHSCDRSLGRCVNSTESEGKPCEISAGVHGPCKHGVTTSVDRWITCVQATLGTSEICDGIDNNCNNSIDDGINRPENCTAPSATGECQVRGTYRCDGAAGWQCVAAPPQDESLFGAGFDCKDNDCDGRVDEGVPDGGPCSASLGECAAQARRRCVNGAPQCVPGASSPEVCDGKDNDCDGMIDGADPDRSTLPELCNGVDDNCNGQVDEAFCHPVTISMNDVDDEMHLWIGQPGHPSSAVCSAHLRSGKAGAASCDLVAIARSAGLAPGRVDFTIKLRNSGCWGTHGNADVTIDGTTTQVMRQPNVVAHCNWVERQEFTIDFVTGEIFLRKYDACTLDWSCPN